MQVLFTDYRTGAAAATVLMNSAPTDNQGEQLLAPTDLRELLSCASIGVDLGDYRATPEDVRRAAALRGELRSLVAASDLESVVSDLNGLLQEHPPRLALRRPEGSSDWEWHLVAPEGAHVGEWLPTLVATALLTLVEAHGLERFRECSAADCQGMFIDVSRGGRRRYCDPTRCGNRTHVAAYRDRRKQ